MTSPVVRFTFEAPVKSNGTWPTTRGGRALRLRPRTRSTPTSLNRTELSPAVDQEKKAV